MKTPEELAEEFATDWHKDCNYPESLLRSAKASTKTVFLAGYQAAKDEEATKDQKIAELWTESIKKMLPSVHEIVLFPSDSAKANKARDAEIVAKMDAAVKRAKDQLADAEKMMPQWISVKERLPEYDQLVLIWHPGFKRPYVSSRVDSALMSPLYWWRCELDMYEPEEVITHWMALPEAPEEEK